MIFFYTWYNTIFCVYINSSISRNEEIFIFDMINYVNLNLADLLREWETEALRSQFRDFEQQSTSSWSASFAAIHGPRATDIRRRCDLQLRVNARQDKRNLSFSLSPIEAWLAVLFGSIVIHCRERKKTDIRLVT